MRERIKKFMSKSTDKGGVMDLMQIMVVTKKNSVQYYIRKEKKIRTWF